MSGIHDAEHEAILAELLEAGPPWDEAERRIEHCPECRTIWEERRRIVEALDEAASLEREVLAEVAEMETSPGEEHVRDWVLRAERAGSAGSSRGRWLWMAAVAAGLVVMGWIAARTSPPQGEPAPLPLGEGTPEQAGRAPVDEVEDFARFTWELGLPGGGYYVVHVVPSDEQGPLPEIESGELEVPVWEPDVEERSGWRSIRWSVRGYSFDGKPWDTLPDVSAWLP